MTEPAPRLRVDKWLWHARFFKSRSIASQAIGKGKVRLNGQKLSRASVGVRSGDVLTLRLGPTIKVIAIKALGERRGPASEAQLLYDILDETKRATLDTSGN
ncbi:MAG: RNA-binding S4 domain-containing protein [Pseudomonadota bacterium]